MLQPNCIQLFINIIIPAFLGMLPCDTHILTESYSNTAKQQGNKALILIHKIPLTLLKRIGCFNL